MRSLLLLGLLAGLLFATGATALALVDDSEATIIAAGAETLDPGSVEAALRPVDGFAAKPAAQTGVASINGLAIQSNNPTCGSAFTVHVNVTNTTGQPTPPGTVSLRNVHRGSGHVNYTGSQNYPSVPPGGNYVVPFQVLINSYESRGQELTASTNGNSFNLRYDLRQGNCSKGFTPIPSPPSGNNQYIQVRHSGKCLDVPGGSQGTITPVQQFSCTGNNNQSWSLESVGNGYFRIVSRFSGMCLDVQGFSQQAHALIQQFPCNGGDNQSFSFRHASGGYNMIVAKHSGLCLDVPGSSNNDKISIQQYPCHGSDNQLWRIR
ncbi:MAG: ricin-type beta-trefoil lectin domain protein [Anaerolineae bacterium]|nr:ricin-type beta-trefoil lectin domain protein [Anaerolineae bacterium]